jgi:putative heme-binding domain-containing protein
MRGGEASVDEALLRGLVRGWPKDRPARVDRLNEDVLKALARELPLTARTQLVRLVESWRSHALDGISAEIAAALWATTRDGSQSDSRRINAARQLIELRAPDEGTARQLLALIAPRTAPELAAGLVDAVSASKAPQVGKALIEILPKLAPSVRSRVLTTLLGRSDWSPALVEAFEQNRVRVSELALDQMQALAAHPNREIAARARRLLSQGGGLPDPDRQKVLEQIAPLVKEGGDPARGKLVFQQQCAKCHRHGNEGTQVGPDLTGMAALPRDELLIHILDPSRSVEGNYVAYTVATNDGRVINGLLASETRSSVDLLDSEGKRQVVLRQDIDEINATNKSLMPDGFEKQVTPIQLNDLLAFLTQRGKYMPLDLRKVATVVTTSGMFADPESSIERLIFPDWSPKLVDGVPFLLVDPQGDRVKNMVLLRGPQGGLAPRMPRTVDLPCHAKARAIHLLSGVSGWGFPMGREGSVSMIVRLHYADGSVEDHPLKNGVHFADYVRVVNVPGSKLAFNLQPGGQQLRYLAVHPKRNDSIEHIELVKGPDRTAPIVAAVTVEIAGAQ